MLHLDIPRLICIMHFCFVLAIRYKFNLLKSTKNTILDENKCFCGISYICDKGEYIDADLKNVNFKWPNCFDLEIWLNTIDSVVGDLETNYAEFLKQRW